MIALSKEVLKSLSIVYLLLFIIEIRLCKVELIIQLTNTGAQQPIEEKYNLHTTKHFEQLGDLTKTGMRQQFDLGRMISQNENYRNLFPQSLDYNSIEFVSSNTNSAITSGMALLAGIFYQKPGLELNTPSKEENYLPPFELNETENESIDENLAVPDSIKTIPIRSFNPQYNFMFHPEIACEKIQKQMKQKFDYWIKKKKLDDFFKDTYDVLKEEGYQVEEIFQEKDWDFHKLAYITPIILADRYDNKEPQLNCSLKLESHLLMTNSIIQYLTLQDVEDPEFGNIKNLKTYRTRLYAAWLQILENFEKDLADPKKHSDSLTRVFLFSGNSLNLASFLMIFCNGKPIDEMIKNYLFFKQKFNGIQNEKDFENFLRWFRSQKESMQIPSDLSFASNLIIELHSPDNLKSKSRNFQNLDNWTIRLTYNGNKIDFSSTEKELSLQDFKKNILKKNIISTDDYKKNCQNSLFEKSSVNDHMFYILVSLVGVNLVLIGFFIFCFVRVYLIKKKNFVEDKSPGQRLLV